jgi:hypothetical protein
VWGQLWVLELVLV